MDSGSTYTWVAAALLRTLSVVPTERRRVVTIEGQVAERDAAEVLITLEGRALHTVCLFGDAGDLDVLGAYTLEGFGLGVDPVQRRFVPALQFGAATASARALVGSAGCIHPCALTGRCRRIYPIQAKNRRRSRRADDYGAFAAQAPARARRPRSAHERQP